ncbi:MAG: hypothetical protein U1F43_16510, partial [Myxococcota bacterium]
PEKVVALDAAVDRKLGELATLFRTLASLLAGAPEGVRWQRLVDATFAAGATWYTNKAYIEEAAAITQLKAELARDEWRDLVSQPLAQQALAELDAVYAPYAEQVGQFKEANRVTWDEVKALDLENHRRLCVFVAGIVHTLASDADGRKAALAPVAQQDQAVYELLRDRLKVSDIDATTGTTLPDAPTGAGVPAQPPT